jgi:hypothetical protein
MMVTIGPARQQHLEVAEEHLGLDVEHLGAVVHNLGGIALGLGVDVDVLVEVLHGRESQKVVSDASTPEAPFLADWGVCKMYVQLVCDVRGTLRYCQTDTARPLVTMKALYIIMTVLSG